MLENLRVSLSDAQIVPEGGSGLGFAGAALSGRPGPVFRRLAQFRPGLERIGDCLGVRGRDEQRPLFNAPGICILRLTGVVANEIPSPQNRNHPVRIKMHSLNQGMDLKNMRQYPAEGSAFSLRLTAARNYIGRSLVLKQSPPNQQAKCLSLCHPGMGLAKRSYALRQFTRHAEDFPNSGVGVDGHAEPYAKAHHVVNTNAIDSDAIGDITYLITMEIK